MITVNIQNAMKLSLLASVISLAHAVQLEDTDTSAGPFHLLSGTVDDILDGLDAEFGTSTWVPPVETRGTFETDLNNVLDDWYDKVGAAWGAGAYGEFYEHGGAEDLDWDFGLDPHGIPVHQHSHFWYNGDYGKGGAADFAHDYVEVNYPEEQAYSYTVEPTIQWTRLESVVPPQYERPVEDYEHGDKLGFENDYEGHYIEDYFGSPGWDHRHFNFDNAPAFHNHHLHDPYATERRYQPHPEEYYIPIVVDNFSAPQAPAEAAPASTAPDLGAETPLDLQFYLSGDHKKDTHHYEAPSSYHAPKRVYKAPADDGFKLTPVKDDLDFLFDKHDHHHHHHHKHHY